MSDVTETVYSRAPDVVWRLGPDRVLVRRVGGKGGDAAAELIGEAALAWIALDQPGTMFEISRRLAEAAAAWVGAAAVDGLMSLGWLSTTEACASA